MKVTVDTQGIDAQVAKIRGLADKKIQAAAAAALNDAARAGYEATKKEMSRVFDKPTSWVLGGVRYTKATSNSLESKIDFEQWGNKAGVTVAQVLRSEIAGGQRRHKRHEVALLRAGILPAGMFIVPGTAADIDANGNMRGSQIVQILAWFRSFGEQGYRANMSDQRRRKQGGDNKRTGQKGFQYFALQERQGRLLPGIYQRFSFGKMGSAVKPVMVFVRAPNYRSRFDFYGVAGKAAREQFDSSFETYLARMLSEREL